jgi:hypothetical protein
MRTLLLALGLTLLAGDAYAISRYNSSGMSCDQVRATIWRDGAAIVRYRSARTGAQLFGRYVRDDYFCATSMRAEIVYITAADTPSCLVWECKYFDIDDDIFLLDD